MLETKAVFSRSASSSASVRSRSAASTVRLSVTSSIVKRALPSGSGTAANSNSRPSVQRDPAGPLLALDGGAADQLADQAGMARVLELRGRYAAVSASIARMAGELLLLELPQLAEAVVPEVEPAVRGEHADRLEQIVEGGGAHPKQGVAGRGELELLGPVLEDEQQAAVGQRLGDDPQMLAAGQQPILLLGGEAAGEPAAMLLLPVGIVAHLGQVAGLAHRVEQPVELGPVGEEIGRQREQPREGLVEEDQAAVAAELGDAGGEPVEHVALGVDEAGELGARLLAVLDVDRIAGDPASPSGTSTTRIIRRSPAIVAGTVRAWAWPLWRTAAASAIAPSSPSSTSSSPPSITARPSSASTAAT